MLVAVAALLLAFGFANGRERALAPLLDDHGNPLPNTPGPAPDWLEDDSQHDEAGYLDRMRETSGHSLQSQTSHSGKAAWWCGKPWWCRNHYVRNRDYKNNAAAVTVTKKRLDKLKADAKAAQAKAIKLQEATAEQKRLLAAAQNQIVRVKMVGQSLDGVHRAAMDSLNVEKARRGKLGMEAESILTRARGAAAIQRSLNSTVHRIEKELARMHAETVYEDKRTENLAQETTTSMEESGKIQGQAAATRVSLQLQIDESNEIVESSEGRVASLKALVADTDRRRNETVYAIDHAKAEHSRLQKAREEAIKEARALELSINTLQAQFATARDERRGAVDEASSMSRDQKAEENAERMAQDKSASLNEEQAFVDRVLAAGQTAAVDTDSQLTGLKQRRSALVAEIQRLGNETSKLRAHKTELQEMHNALRVNASAIKADLDMAKEELSAQVQRQKQAELQAEHFRARAESEKQAERVVKNEERHILAAGTLRHAKHVEAMAEGLMGFCDCSQDEGACPKCGPHAAQPAAKELIDDTVKDAAAEANGTAAELEAANLLPSKPANTTHDKHTNASHAEDYEGDEEHEEHASASHAEGDEVHEEHASASHAEGDEEHDDLVHETDSLTGLHHNASDDEVAQRFHELLADPELGMDLFRFRERRGQALRGQSSLGVLAAAEAQVEVTAHGTDPLSHLLTKEQKSVVTMPTRYRPWPWAHWCIWRKYSDCRAYNYAWNLARHYRHKWWRENRYLRARLSRAQGVQARAQSYFNRAEEARKQAEEMLNTEVSANKATRQAVKDAKIKEKEMVAQMKRLDAEMQQAYKDLTESQGTVEGLRFKVQDLREEKVQDEVGLDRAKKTTAKAEQIYSEASIGLAASRKHALEQEKQLRDAVAALDDRLRTAVATVADLELKQDGLTNDLHAAQEAHDAAEAERSWAEEEANTAIHLRDERESTDAKLEEGLKVTQAVTIKARQATEAALANIAASRDGVEQAKSEMRALRGKLERTKAAMHAAGSAHSLSASDASSLGIAVRRLQDDAASKEAEVERLHSELRSIAEDSHRFTAETSSGTQARQSLQAKVNQAKQRVSAAGAVERHEAELADLAAAERDARAAHRDELAKKRHLLTRSPLERMSETLRRRRELEALVGGERAAVAAAQVAAPSTPPLPSLQVPAEPLSPDQAKAEAEDSGEPTVVAVKDVNVTSKQAPVQDANVTRQGNSTVAIVGNSTSPSDVAQRADADLQAAVEEAAEEELEAEDKVEEAKRQDGDDEEEGSDGAAEEAEEEEEEEEDADEKAEDEEAEDEEAEDEASTTKSDEASTTKSDE